jgi:hypothetical protein
MSNYYLGTSPENILGNTPRYFYALRKNENGSLYFVKNDNIKDGQVININNLGNLEDNYNDFEEGVDFYEGINVNHIAEFANLKYPQYRWDNRSVLYYIDNDGQLVVRLNQGYTYPTGVSEEE